MWTRPSPGLCDLAFAPVTQVPIQSRRLWAQRGSRIPLKRRIIADGSKARGFEVDLSKDLLECPSIREYLQTRPSPFAPHKNYGGGFVNDYDRVSLKSLEFASLDSTGAGCKGVKYCTLDEESGAQVDMCLELPNWAVRAGARETIYMNPKKVTAAIVTCGGLCPGLNDVVAGLVNKLTDYGVEEGNIMGIRYGFQGFYDPEHKPVTLTSESVDGIHLQGGTILGTSRGGADIRKIVKKIDMWGINMVFVIGGNGGNAGANAIHECCTRNGVHCSVVAVPKSIDNDILLIDKCFGFDTAVEEAQRALLAAKVEASSAHNGIGLVKLMGRQSGFIALQSSMASGVVDAVLIPEVPFELYGKYGLFAYLKKVLQCKGHAVVCIAEGAGQNVSQGHNLNASRGVDTKATDASGNPILKDVGKQLRNEMKSHFEDADVKYIDPTYMIRAIPCASTDRVYCKILAHNAVHAAFAGYTGITVGLVNTHYVYLPIPVVIAAPRMVDPMGKMWNRLRGSIGQPNFCEPDDEPFEPVNGNEAEDQKQPAVPQNAAVV